MRLNKLSVSLGTDRQDSHPLRIAHLSDTHLGTIVSERQVTRAVDAANAASPDLIALTGDYVFSRRHTERCARLLGGLRAPLGVFAVLGNHDEWLGPTYIQEALEAQGMTVLANAARQLEFHGRAIWLGGVSDLSEGGDVEAALQGIPQDEPLIFLSHNPDAAYHVENRSACLVLSGHTHGGQVRWLGRYLVRDSSFGVSHPHGLYNHGQAQIYVTNGVGTVYLPVRILCPPEVALLEVSF